MRLSTTTIGEFLREVNSAVERKASIFIEINVKRLEVSRSVDDTNITSLDEVVGHDQVLLVRCDLEIVRSDGRLVLIGIIQTLDVVEVTDVKRSNMVGCGKSCVEVFTVLADVGAGRILLAMMLSVYTNHKEYLLNGNRVTGLGTKVIEFLNYTLITIGVFAQRVNDPKLTQVYGSGDSSRFGVSRNELDVLDTTALIWVRRCGLIKYQGWLTLGMVRVLRIFLESRSQRRSVSAWRTPRLGFKMEIGSTKSEVKMSFFSQSILSP